MLTAQVEPYSEVFPELLAVYPRHWRELAVSKDIPLAPNYQGYAALDQAGHLLLVTLRDGQDKLAGYFIGFLFPELHYSSVIACTGDIFYVLPEYRGRGLPGVRLFREVERALRLRGVDRWHVTSKLTNSDGEDKDSGALLRRLGFQAVEVHYSKRLSRLN